LLTRIQVREADLVWHAVTQREWRITVLRGVKRFGGPEITRFGCIVVRFAVHDAAANAQHGFGSNLIGRTEPWSEGIRIVLRECAVTLSRSVSFKDDPAGKAAGRRVRRSGADTEHVAAMFFQVSLKVIAQAVIHRQFAI